MAPVSQQSVTPIPGLNLQQARFVAEYLKDFNATRAAITAGYTPRRADVHGSRLLVHVRVAEVIRKHQEARAKCLGITADRVLEEVARIAFASVGDLLDDEGNWRHPRDMSDDLLDSLPTVIRPSQLVIQPFHQHPARAVMREASVVGFMPSNSAAPPGSSSLRP